MPENDAEKPRQELAESGPATVKLMPMISRNPTNERFFDRFSIVHAGAGAVAELSQIPAPLAIAGQTAFELIENPLKDAFASVFPDPTHDSWQNTVGDILSFTAGYYVARAIQNTRVGMPALMALGAIGAAIWIGSLAPAVQRAKTVR